MFFFQLRHYFFEEISTSRKINLTLMLNVQVLEPLEGSQMRRIYSAYPGTGSVYSVIAKSGKSAVAYVPSLTYACSTVYWTDTCDVLSELTIIIRTH